MDEAPSVLALSHPLSRLALSLSLPPPYLTPSISSSLPILVHISLTPSRRPPAISSSLSPLSFHPHFKPHIFLFLYFALSHYFSPFLPYLACRCIVSLVPFKARQMERQALSPSSGPNDLFLTMGPNGPRIINDERSMER